MNSLRAALKQNHLLQSNNVRSIPTISLLLRDSLRHFSTEKEPQSKSSTPIDALLHPPNPDFIYGKLMGISPNTIKSDIINMFEGCKLTPDDIKVDYDKLFSPMAMFLQFSSMSDYIHATRQLSRKNRYFKLDKSNRQLWDMTTPYNGRYVLLQGIPRAAVLEDVERLLSGCYYDPSGLEMFSRNVQSQNVRFAKVRFPSQIEAMNAVVRKNGSFCLNSRITARLIQ
ncbi:unnamed protein product [Amaranthus hypochondriacus]